MKLYYSPGACSLAPHIVAREANLELSLVRVDLATKQTSEGTDLIEATGRGSVPALETDDGKLLREGPAIMQYLADAVPVAGLIPDCGSFDRYKLQEWLNFLSAEVHKTFSILWSAESSNEARTLAKEQLFAKFLILDHHLSVREWILGNFGPADAYAFTIIGWAGNFEIELDRWPNIAAYMKRISQRPAVRAAMKAEAAPLQNQTV